MKCALLAGDAPQANVWHYGQIGRIPSTGCELDADFDRIWNDAFPGEPVVR